MSDKKVLRQNFLKRAETVKTNYGENKTMTQKSIEQGWNQGQRVRKRLTKDI